MKIGVFDSGFGGLTVLKEFMSLFPDYDYVYLGDNARTPYGTRSFETIYKYTLQSVQKLFDLDCNLVILACNTASARALRTIQQNDLSKIAPDSRVLGVIRPSAEAVAEYSKNNVVGILATNGTVASNSYVLEIKNLFPDIQVFQQACPMWVPLVENNEHLSDGADYFVQDCIIKLLNQNRNIDTIILACTHYPLLINKIKKFIPKNINVLIQGHIVAKSLKNYLYRHPEIDKKLSKNSSIEFYTTDIVEAFNQKANLFLGGNFSIKAKNIIID